MKEFKPLKKNGTISLVAPSFGCTTEPYKTRLDVAIKNMEALGYTIDQGENIYLNKGRVASNTPRKRAKEFMDAYLSSSDCVIAVGGGELMNEMLPYVNFDKLKKAPAKIFMGFSDPTNLTFTLTTICDVPTIYGCNFPAFAFAPFEYSRLDNYNLLIGASKRVVGYPCWQKEHIESEDPLASVPYSSKKIIKPFPNVNEVTMEGIILGGNLDILSNLCGTKYDAVEQFNEKYKDKGIIWYFEACDLNVLSIRRALFELKEAGWFKYAKGFLIGRPLCFGQKIMGVNQYNAVKDVLKSFHKPILMDVDIGHFDPSMPMINGLEAKVTYQNNNIEIEYK